MAATATPVAGLSVSKAALIALFVELGFQTADRWTDTRLTQKLVKLPTMVDANTAVADPENAKLLKKVLKTLAAGGDVTIAGAPADPDDDDAPVATAKPAAKAKPAPVADPDDDDDAPAPVAAKPAAKPAVAAVPDDDDDDDAPPAKPAAKPAKVAKPAPAVAAVDDDDEVPAKPAAEKPKGKKPESAAKNGGPGIIASIVEFLSAATEEKPINKERILAKLVKRFPDRDPDSMKNTINIQVPNRIKTDKHLNVIKTEQGYYIAGKVEAE